MKTKSALSIIAILTAVAAGPAFAEDNNKSGNGLVDSVTGTVGDVTNSASDTVGGVTSGVNDTLSGDNSSDVDTGDVTGSIGDTSNSVGDIGTFGDFLNELNAGNLNGDVSGIGDVSNVSVVDVQDVFNDFDATAFNDALSNNSTQVADLQNALSGNSVLNDYLNGNNISVTDVVGIDNNQDGSLVIYTNSDE